MMTVRDQIMTDILHVLGNDAQLMAALGVATIKTGHTKAKRTYQAHERIYMDVAKFDAAMPYLVHEMAVTHIRDNGVFTYGKYYVSIFADGDFHSAAAKASELEANILRLLRRIRINRDGRDYSNLEMFFNRSRMYETGKTTTKHRMITFDAHWLDNSIIDVLAGRNC